MKTKILGYIDFEKVNTLLEGFNQSMGFVTAILDLDGNVLSKSGWRPICAEFHRVHPETSKRCTLSNTILAGELIKGEKYRFYKCLNGLIDVAVPIVIKDQHIANLFSGQFFLEEPDYSLFQEQAAKYGFDESVYLKALKDVPVISEEKVKVIMEFLLNMTQLISDITLQKMELMKLTDTLRESEETYRTLYESLNDALFTSQLNEDGSLGKFILVNNVACQRLGHTREELLNKTPADINSEKAKQSLTSRIQQILKKKRAVVETEHVTKDGRIIPIELSTNVTTFKGKTVFNSIARDITERKQADLLIKEKTEKIEAQNEEYQQINEELNQANQELYIAKQTLEESEERLRFSLEGANDGIWDVNMLTNEVYISPRGCEILGYSPNEMLEIAKVWSDLVCPDDLPQTNEILQQYLSGNKPIFEIEQRLKTKSGEFKWVLTRGKVIIKDQLGNPLRMTGTHTDISNRKKEELIKIQNQQLLKQQNEEYLVLNEELNRKNEEFIVLNENLKTAKERAEENEQMLNSIYNAVGDVIFHLAVEGDGRYRFISANEAFSTVTGIKQDDVIGKLINDVIPEPSLSLVLEKYRRAITERTMLIWEETTDYPTGRLVGEVRIAPVFDSKGHCSHLVGSVHNITDRKHAEIELLKAKEKAEETDRLKTAFLQNMSHEIRTPMNAIMGFSSILVDHADDKNQLKYFTDIINERCRDLLDIINDILDISKIESGQLPVNFQESNLNDLFAELNSFFTEHQKRIGKQQIEFSLQAFDGQSEKVILTDKVKLKQILINLISNAFKFTDTGKIECGCKFDENHNLLFYVSDTGIGIPSDKQELIFERFFQLKQGSEKFIGGTGLGLSIVKGLVTLLGGEIFLESQTGKGSIFSFIIPYKDSSRFTF